MKYYLYDGSFQGLLTVVYQIFYQRESNAKIICEDRYQESLFAEKTNIDTESKKADLVYDAIKEKISSQALRKVYYSFLSEGDGIENLILDYLVLGFKMGKKINGHFTNEIVLKLNQIASKVGAERHRLLGLIRFRKIRGGIFYAPLEPDNNLVPVLAPHFVQRLADQHWIIHDLKRRLAVVYNREECLITTLEKMPFQETAEEGFYQDLWKEFFQKIAIENRKNPKLQKQFMPGRYWKFLIEKE